MLTRWVPLSKAEKRVLRALLQGAQLKAHRYLDGSKVHKLHLGETEPLETPIETIGDGVITRLTQRGLICSNLKFPTATYVLTKMGKAKGLALVDWGFAPVTSHL